MTKRFFYSDTVGMVADYTGGAVVNAECRGYPYFGKLIFDMKLLDMKF